MIFRSHKYARFPAPEIPSRPPPAVSKLQEARFQLKFELNLPAELESIQEQPARQQVSFVPPIPGLRFDRIRPNFIVSVCFLTFSRCAFPFSSLSQSGFHRVTRTAPPIGRRKKAHKRRALDAVLVVATATPLLLASLAVVYPYTDGAAAGAPAAAARSPASAR